jgi:hypothetical protein
MVKTTRVSTPPGRAAATELLPVRAASGDEVDLVRYGERGLAAFEVKMARDVRPDDLRGRFSQDYPSARAHLAHLGTRCWHDRGIEVLPVADCLASLDRWI